MSGDMSEAQRRILEGLNFGYVCHVSASEMPEMIHLTKSAFVQTWLVGGGLVWRITETGRRVLSQREKK